MARNNSVAAPEDDFVPGQNMEGTMTPGEQLLLDFSSVDENGGFEPLPVGTYPATIGAFGIKESKAGNQMVAVTFTIMHPDYVNRKLFAHFVLNNEISLGRLKKFLINVFPDYNLASVNFTEIINSGAAIGRTCTLVVTQRPYNNAMTNEVKEVLAPQADGLF